MRILFIHEVDYENKPIFEMHEFPELLALRGHQISFLDFTEDSNPKATGFKSEVFMQPRLSKKAKIRAFHQTPRAPGILGRLVGAIESFRAIRRAIQLSNPDVVVTFAVPTMGWQAAMLCRRLNVPLVYRALDVSHLIRKTRLAFLVRMAEAYVCRKAVRVSANNEALLQHCRKLARKAINGATNFPPLAIEKFQPETPYRASKRLPSIVYMGSFFYFSGLDRVLARFAQRAIDDVSITLVGGGEQDRYLRRVVKSLGIENSVTFTGFISFDDLPKELSKHRVAINPMLRSDVSNLAFPNKVIQYMASGLPVVTTRLAGLAGTFGPDAPFAWTLTPEQALDTAIDLVRDEALCDKMSKDAFVLLESKFAPELSVKSLEKMLGEIANAT